jgi:flagellar hook-associated protein 2
MSSISSAGIGSGLDVNSIVTQLIAVEKAPLQQMQSQASAIQDKLSAYGKIQSFVSTLRDAASNLTKASTWADTTATSGDTSVLTATTDTNAAAGNYSLTVQQLASAQMVASPASVFPIGSGTLRIDVGSLNAGGTGIDLKPGTTSVNVKIDAGDTAAQVRDKINAAKAGVTASIITDAAGSRLVLRGSETGKGSAFTITGIDDPADLTTPPAQRPSNLTFSATDLAAATDELPGTVSTSQMTFTQAAVNAKATINGLAVETTSNVMSGVLDGVTVKIAKVSTTPVELTVTSNTDSIKKAITSFTDAYNGLNRYLADQTKYDAANKVGATLQGDSGTNALRSAMRGIMSGTAGASGVFHRLSELGIAPQVDGSLTVDNTKLSAGLAKLADVKDLFAKNDASLDTDNGFGARFKKWGDALLSFDGSLTTRSDSLRRQISANSKKQDTFNTRMTTVEARLRAQYSALDTKMATLNGLSSYLTQQITNMNKSIG